MNFNCAYTEGHLGPWTCDLLSFSVYSHYIYYPFCLCNRQCAYVPIVLSRQPYPLDLEVLGSVTQHRLHRPPFWLLLLVVWPRLHGTSHPAAKEALQEWKVGHSHQPPVSPGNIHQRCWDQPCVQATLDGLSLMPPMTPSTKQGSWRAPHRSQVPGWMPYQSHSQVYTWTTRWYIQLLGSAWVFHCATHGLSCYKMEGRLSRHSAF